MDLLSIILIAIGVAMDDFAAAIAVGMNANQNRWKFALILASVFALFQMIFPLAGWLVGLGLREVIVDVDHWIAFGLLAFLGADMIFDSLKNDSKKKEKVTMLSLLMIAAATSIDELMVGVTFAFLVVSIVITILILAIIDFFVSFAGSLFGSQLGILFGNKIKAFGGIILIIIGIQILVEHMV